MPTVRPEGRLAMGFSHVVLLREDGTVFSAGENDAGQRNVEDWRGVVMVAAGARHTLGLTADGRVLAAGDNTFGQCETSLFTGVTAIAAGYYDSYVLFSDGRVLAVGYGSAGDLSALPPARAIFAGAYGFAALTDEGVFASHPSLAVSGKPVSLAVSRGYLLSIDGEGKTRSTSSLVPSWRDAARVAAGENAALCLTGDGRVLCHRFGRNNQMDTAFSGFVTDIAAGPEDCAFLYADGTLEIRHRDGQKETLYP